MWLKLRCVLVIIFICFRCVHVNNSACTVIQFHRAELSWRLNNLLTEEDDVFATLECWCHLLIGDQESYNVTFHQGCLLRDVAKHTRRLV